MRLTVKDVPGLDGDYDADFSRFTNNEGKLIKRLSGVRMGEIRDAMKAGDNDLIVACAVVFMARAGKDPEMVEQLLGEADIGCIELDVTDEEKAEAKKLDADARPPDSPTQNGNGNELDALERLTGKNEPSGAGTEPSSAPGPTVAIPDGSLRSDTGSTYVPAT